MGYCYMLAISCTRLISKIAVLITFTARNPCRIPGRRTLSLRRVLMIDSTTFHRNSNMTIPWVFMFPFVMRTRIVHQIYLGIYPWCHMN